MTTACLSTNATNHFDLGSRPDRLFVATVAGIVTLERDQSGNWGATGHALEADHITALGYDAASNTVFAARLPGSLVRSNDDGTTWCESSPGVREPGTYSLRTFPGEKGPALYLGTQPVGLYRSDDGGANWADLAAVRTAPMHERWQFPSPEHQPHLKALAVDPRDPRVIYAGVEQGGLLKSVDAGQSWRDLDEFVDYDHFVYKDIHQVVLHPADPDVVIITTGLGIFRSRDAGETWQQLTDGSFRIGYPDQILFAPGDANRVLVAGGFATPNFWVEQKSARGTVMVSTDGGDTWRAPAGGFPETRANVEVLTLCTFPGGTQVFAGTTDGDVFVSEDFGDTWARIAQGLPPIGKPTHDTLIAGEGYDVPAEALTLD